MEELLLMDTQLCTGESALCWSTLTLAHRHSDAPCQHHFYRRSHKNRNFTSMLNLRFELCTGNILKWTLPGSISFLQEKPKKPTERSFKWSSSGNETVETKRDADLLSLWGKLTFKNWMWLHGIVSLRSVLDKIWPAQEEKKKKWFLLVLIYDYMTILSSNYSKISVHVNIEKKHQ